MVFNSGIFLQFFAAFLLLYWLVRGSLRARTTLILAASCLFYGWWSPAGDAAEPATANPLLAAVWHCRFLALLLGTSTLDFFLARLIDQAKCQARRKQLLILSVVANLGVLGFFKYADFFLSSVNAALEALGVSVSSRTLGLVLPVGISFYTFQSMSYTIDVYRREMPATPSLGKLLAYVAFFPQLVAGPIERAKDLLPQFDQTRRITLEMVEQGIWLIVWGLFKKVVLADSFAPLAEMVFGDRTFNVVSVVLGTVAFGLQIYCDFSGYSDIARGLARVLGFELMWNFRLPYFATNLREFWQRWHISLSTWLRDYLYIPLGGNRLGPARTTVNLVTTMLLGGLWHGAAWNFILWGFWHGLGLAVSRTAPAAAIGRRLPQPLAWLGTIVFVFYGWMLFRAGSWEQVVTMTAALGTFAAPVWVGSYVINLVVFAVPLVVIECWQHRSGDLLVPLRWPRWARAALQGTLLVGIVLFWDRKGATFIYFQF